MDNYKLELTRDELVAISDCIYTIYKEGLKNVYEGCDKDFMYEKYCILTNVQYKVWELL